MLVPQRRASGSESTVSRRLAYSLAAGAAACLARNTEAKIVVSGFDPIDLVRGAIQPLSFDSDPYVDVYLRNLAYGDGTSTQNMLVAFQYGKLVGKNVNNIYYAKALAPGYEINSSNVNYFTGLLAKGAAGPYAEFNDVENAYLGVAFPISGDGSPDNYFGWIRVSINNSLGKFVIQEWAYENVLGLPIQAGDRGPAGDFNNDGQVNAADYTVWRNNLGTDYDLAGNGDNLGTSANVVDVDDYQLWKVNFGWDASSAAGAARGSIATPEPTTLGYLAAGSLGLTALRRRRRG
jgi:hypothetical protein